MRPPSSGFRRVLPAEASRNRRGANASRSGYYVFGSAADTDGIVLDANHHSIDDYLSESWIDDWVADVVTEVEDYLGKHAAFDAFLEEDGEPV
jgi:hypothetical protein